MAKIYARFLTPVAKPESGKTKIVTQEFTLQYAEFDEQTTLRIKQEMAKYEICVDKDYSYEYDEDDYPSRGSSRKVVPIEKVVSLSSGFYSTDEPRGDCLIIGGQFVGVVLGVEKKGGNGWSNYFDSWYCVLYTDGRISGENTGEYCFSGESSSKEEEYTYTIREAKTE